ncbi:MAG: DNA gyrase subunit A [Kineosporiaceae bacterium]
MTEQPPQPPQDPQAGTNSPGGIGTGDITSDADGGNRVEAIDLQLEMQRSYLDYAMSVIVGRALPDVRDGLKPVHRRVLYAMYDGATAPTAGTRSAPASSVT